MTKASGNVVYPGHTQTNPVGRVLLLGHQAVYQIFEDKEMIDGLITGRLLGDPEQRVGKAGSQFVVAKVRAQAGDGEHLMVNVIAFDDAPSSALLALHDGDSVALAGSLTPKAWTDKQGNVKPALDLIAQRVLSAYPD